MSNERFKHTPLWKSTLACRTGKDGHADERERLRVAYEATRGTAEHLLAENSRTMPEYTVHDLSHVDALWETASLICGDEITVNPAEAFVLGSAFVLHDAAMGAAAYPNGLVHALGDQRWRDLVSITYHEREGCWPDAGTLADPPVEIIELCRAEAIREAHAEQARRLVHQSWCTSTGDDIFLIPERALRAAYGSLIGDLAASHGSSVDLLPRRFHRAIGSLPWQPAEWIIDPLKLACILRLADATQLDGRRAPTFLQVLRAPQGESRDHWRFQEFMSRPHLLHDRVTFTSPRDYGPEAADAWWLALDYLRSVDQELKQVDALLHDLGRSRLAARAVAGVESPERFAELFPVTGWRPVDAVVKIANPPALVSALGGSQLYGNEPEVALRELIQNAQDAVLARRSLDPAYRGGCIEVRCQETDGDWYLEVSDDGSGMDEDILVHGLLEFGTSGWGSKSVRKRMPGLAAGGFRPSGRFGIGFFSVFMLGDQVELRTRRFDAASSDARCLTFSGAQRRPMLTTPSADRWVPVGTRVRIKLRLNPFDADGLLRRTDDERLAQLVRRLVLENAVLIRIVEPQDQETQEIAPFALCNGTAEEVFDRLYPSLMDSWRAGHEKQRLELRDAFAARATEMLDESGQRVGLAAIGADVLFWSQLNYQGVVTVNGFRADESITFAGYLEGQANRASRDQVDLAATKDQVRHWMRGQETRLRDIGKFNDSIQLELAGLQHRILNQLSRDHAIAMTGHGLLRLDGVRDWADPLDEVFLAMDLLIWETRPPQLMHIISGQRVLIPGDWAFPCEYFIGTTFLDMFPPTLNRDPAYEDARNHPMRTWQKMWWRTSGSLSGKLIRELSRVWSCTIGELLTPVEQRRWTDTRYLEGIEQPVWGFLLRRP